MPTSSQYARYRADRTTIWVSKTAAAFLVRERESLTESSGTVLDRLLTELRRARRGAGGDEAERRPASRGATKSASKGAAKSASKGVAKSASKGAKRAPKSASKGASGAKGGRKASSTSGARPGAKASSTSRGTSGARRGAGARKAKRAGR